jgi:HD-GYP domain-containing protein (c-di-GMP phosphodiesterase class II)
MAKTGTMKLLLLQEYDAAGQGSSDPVGLSDDELAVALAGVVCGRGGGLEQMVEACQSWPAAAAEFARWRAPAGAGRILPLRIVGSVVDDLDGGWEATYDADELGRIGRRLAAQMVELAGIFMRGVITDAGSEAASGPAVAHGRRVARYAVETARALGLSATVVDEAALAGFMHALQGSCPGGHHAQSAGQGWEAFVELGGVGEAVGRMHETYDGAASPAGIGGTAIPIVSRILLAVDAFDVMTGEGDGGASCDAAAAVRLFERRRGQWFDPRVLDAFHEIYEDLIDARRAA